MNYSKDTLQILKERLRMYENLNKLDLNNKSIIKQLKDLITYSIEIINNRIKTKDYTLLEERNEIKSSEISKIAKIIGIKLYQKLLKLKTIIDGIPINEFSKEELLRIYASCFNKIYIGVGICRKEFKTICGVQLDEITKNDLIVLYNEQHYTIAAR